MTTYSVLRHADADRLTDRVILLHAPTKKAGLTQVRRVEAISDWRYVGDVESSNDNLDRLTGVNGMAASALFKRTGVDVLNHTLCRTA